MTNFKKKLLYSLTTAFVLSSHVTVTQACTGVGPMRLEEIPVADFENGRDFNGELFQSIFETPLETKGPFYAWYPPTVDNINFWDIYSNGRRGGDNFVDYIYRLNPPQNWNNYPCLNIKYSLFSKDKYGRYGKAGIRVFVHDANNPGNDGYTYFGDYSTFSQNYELLQLWLGLMDKRDKVDQILIRVHESFFGGQNSPNVMQRTHIYNIGLK